MARDIPARIKGTKAGTAFAPTAPVLANGDAIPPDAVLYVNNGSGAPITLTVDTPGDAGDGLAIAQYTVTIPATSARLVGPFSDQVYRQTSGPTAGLVHVDYSSATSVTRAVIS